MSHQVRSPSKTSLKLLQLLQKFQPHWLQSTSRIQRLQPLLRTDLAQSCQPQLLQTRPTVQLSLQEDLTTRVQLGQTSRNTVQTARTAQFLLKTQEANTLADLSLKDKVPVKTNCQKSLQQPQPANQEVLSLQELVLLVTEADSTEEERLPSTCSFS